MGLSVEKDEELISRAHEEIAEERHMEAARLLQQVQDKSLLQGKHLRTMQLGADMEELLTKELQTNGSPVDSGWKKNGEAHNKHDVQIFYKVDDSNSLTFRVDLVIEESLLVPLLAVMNESELYATWMPSWNRPRLGVRQSTKLHEMGRGNQIIQVTVDMPPPFATREVIQYAIAVDDINKNSAILIQSKHLDPGPYTEDIEISSPDKGVVRIDFDCGMVIRHCPDDHPVLAKSKKVYPPEEKKVLLTIKQFVDAHVKYVPLTLINFVNRQVIKTLVGNLLHVAEKVKSGELPQHKEAIEANAELYKWVERRMEVLCSKSATDEDSEELNTDKGSEDLNTEEGKTDP